MSAAPAICCRDDRRQFAIFGAAMPAVFRVDNRDLNNMIDEELGYGSENKSRMQHTASLP